MNFQGSMWAKAKSLQKKLVLADGTEPRTIKAARIIVDERLAGSVTLLGKESVIEKRATKEGVSLSDIAIVNPEISSKEDAYAEEYYQLRKLRGMTIKQAKTDIVSPMRWGAMMVHLGEADAVVGGMEDDPVEVLFAGLAIIGTAPSIRTASSCLVIQSQDTSWGADGAFIFSDCSVVPNPMPDQLTDIALSAAESCRDFLGVEPVVALLSYSTKGSKREHHDLEKIRTALKKIKTREPALIVDGELQLDAALIPAVAEAKAKDSPVRGRANTLVFPNIEAGNIGYKLVQYFGKVEIFGPILQGFAKPISYVPRGATVNSIVLECAATLARVKQE